MTKEKNQLWLRITSLVLVFLFMVTTSNIDVMAASVLSISAEASETELLTGQKIVLSATATGGSGNYTYSFLVHNKSTGKWARLTETFTSDNTYTWKAKTKGEREFFVEVKDSTGKVVRSKAVIVNTIDKLSVKGSSSASTVGLGKTIKLTATATGGSGVYSYSYIIFNKKTNKWYRLADNISSSEYTWKAKNLGDRIIYIDVKDNFTGKVVRSNPINIAVTDKMSVTDVNITNKQDVILDCDSSVNTYQCTVSVTPDTANDKSVTWSSSNIEVATVDSNGLITAIGVGTAIITVKTNDSGYHDTINVYVYESNAVAPEGTFQFSIGSTNERVMEVLDANAYNGAFVQLNTPNDSIGQAWEFQDYISTNGGYAIVPKCNTAGHVLDVNRDGSIKNPIQEGRRVDLWLVGKDDPASMFDLVRFWDGSYVFKLINSNFVVGVTATDVGKSLEVKAFDVNDMNQRWFLKEVDVSYETSPVAQKIVELAQSEVGYKEDPVTSWTKYTEWYVGLPYVPKGYEAWCAMFVSYIRYHAGDTTVSKFSLCRDGVNKYKNAGLYKNFGSYTPKPGDIVFFTTDGTYSSHVGIVESVSNGKINTIEGNFKLNGAYQVVRWSYDAGTGKGGISTYILGYGVTP